MIWTSGSESWNRYYIWSQCELEKMKSAMEEASVCFEEQRWVFLKEVKLDFYEGNNR